MKRGEITNFFGLIVYGPLRQGKSSYAIQLLAETYGILKNPEWKKALNLELGDWAKWVQSETRPDWGAWKEHMVFPPQDFVRKTLESNEKQRCLLVWDDAGFWLSHYTYKNPFIASVSEYMNVIASDWASVIFTAPNPKWLITHVRGLPGGHTGRVSKMSGDRYHRHERYVTVYEGWMSPDMKSGGVSTRLRDEFNVFLPNDVFAEYDQYRRAFALVAKEHMRDTLKCLDRKYGKDSAENVKKEFVEGVGIEP